uniref:Putative dna helicase n=1 Tax=Anopheles marajoara TaxID=58244 RepID=A0A2M4BYH1_9DIPT
MRVQMLRDPSADKFAKQLLAIGDGKDKINRNSGCIKLPSDFCIIVDFQKDIINSVFCELTTNYLNHAWLAERKILPPKNANVDDLNFTIQQALPGNVVSYKSIDTVCNANEAVNYPAEFLNSLNLSGMPPHMLRLKIRSTVILLRNLNRPRLCNGTRLVVKKMMKNIIETPILTGKFKGENVLLPRIPIIPTEFPIEFKRVQFPIKIAFAMTINKFQWQTVSVCGLDLRKQCFSHGQ